MTHLSDADIQAAADGEASAAIQADVSARTATAVSA